MSIASIQQIQQAAKGGFATIDMNSGNVVSGGKGLGGRIASWFRAKLHPGETAVKNSAVMNAFMRAIATDPKYGPQYANMAARELSTRFADGKRLTERAVSNTLSTLEADKVLCAGLNSTKALVTGKLDITGNTNCFGAIFSDAAKTSADTSTNTGAQPLTLESTNTKALQSQIHDSIIAAGDDGRHAVSQTEAREIATGFIKPFIAIRSGEVLQIAQSSLSPKDKDAVITLLLQEATVKEGDAAKFANGMQAQTLSSTMNAIADDILIERGMDDIVGKLNIDGLETTILIKASASPTILSKGEIQAEMRSHLSDFIDKKEATLARVDELGITGTTRDHMRGSIASIRNIKRPEQVDSIQGTTEAYATLCDGLHNGSTSSVSRNFADFFRNMDASFAPLYQQGFEGEDVGPVLDAALATYVGTMPEEDRGIMERALVVLTGDSGLAVASDAAQLSFSRESTPQVSAANRKIQDLRSGLASALADRLGVEVEYDRVRAADQDFYSGSTSNMAGRGQPIDSVRNEVVSLFQDMGISFHPRDLVGRSVAGRYSGNFNAQFTKSINAEFPKSRRWDGDYATDMTREMGRNTFIAGGSRVSIPGAKPAEVRTQLNAFFGNDTAGKRAVSSVVHQGLFGELYDQLTKGNGPVSGLPTPTGDERPSYELTRNADGGYHVLASTSSTVQNLQTTDGETIPLNSEYSRFSTTIEFDISRESIDAGNPQAVSNGKQRYGYAFMPETFTIQEG